MLSNHMNLWLSNKMHLRIFVKYRVANWQKTINFAMTLTSSVHFSVIHESGFWMLYLKRRKWRWPKGVQRKKEKRMKVKHFNDSKWTKFMDISDNFLNKEFKMICYSHFLNSLKLKYITETLFCCLLVHLLTQNYHIV